MPHKKLEQIVNTLKSAHDYELNQLDSFTSQSQLIFFIATIFFGTSFLAIKSDDIIIIITKLILLILLIICMYFACPYIRYRDYDIYPKTNHIVDFTKYDHLNYDELLKYLSEVYQSSVENNYKLNCKREDNFKKSILFLKIATILMFVLFSYYYITKPNSQNLQQSKIENIEINRR